MTIKEFVEEARKIHGDKYDYKSVDFIKKTDKVDIVCPKHGVFKQMVKLHLKGCDRRKCNIEKRANECRSTKDEFIQKAKEVHGNRYDYSKVEYINSITPVEISCNFCGNTFEQRPSNHINMKQGCPFCNGNIKKTTEDFIKEAKIIHNDKYDYSKVNYRNNKSKITIICHEKDQDGNEHGEFVQQALTHLQGHGCPKCVNCYQRNAEEFIKEAKKVHGELYDYNEVVYKDSHSKVKIICHKKDKNGIEHGIFEQVAKNHLKGENCPKCKFENLALINKSTTDEFINKSNKIHNGKYSYSKTVYVNSKLPVIITCKKHGDFEQTPKTHLKGHGCPKCNQSKMESEVINFLESKHIRYIYQASCKDLKWLSKQSLDFYLPDYGIAVECQGAQHFTPVIIFGGKEGFLTNVKRDISKYYKCISNNIKLLYYIDKSIIEQVIDNKTYNNIYDTTNTFYNLTIFNKKYLENRK